jgi:hypothetical protein
MIILRRKENHMHHPVFPPGFKGITVRFLLLFICVLGTKHILKGMEEDHFDITPDKYGKTALHRAAENGDEKEVEKLIAAAKKAGCLEELLNKRDNFEKTARDYAEKGNHTAIVTIIGRYISCTTYIEHNYTNSSTQPHSPMSQPSTHNPPAVNNQPQPGATTDWVRPTLVLSSLLFVGACIYHICTKK